MCLHASWAMYEAGGPRTGTSTRHESRVGSGYPLFCKIFLPEALRGQWHFNHFSPVQLGFDAQWQTSPEECLLRHQAPSSTSSNHVPDPIRPESNERRSFGCMEYFISLWHSFMVADTLHLRMARDGMK